MTVNRKNCTQIDQITLFKIRNHISDEEFEDLVHQEINPALKSITGVLSVTIDRNIIEPWLAISKKIESKFTHALRIRFSSKTALRFYQDHPLKTGIQDYYINLITEDDTTTFYFEATSFYEIEKENNR